MDDTLAAAEAALTQSLHDLAIAEPKGTREIPTTVGAGINRYCEAARAGGLPPEQALIRLKAMVAATYPRRDVIHGLTAADVVWAAVQRCVKAFYGSSASAHRQR